MNTKTIGNDNIVLTVDYKFTSFEVTLQHWIDKSMYKDTRWFISGIKDKDGNILKIDIIPKEYRSDINAYHKNEFLSVFVLGNLKKAFHSLKSLLMRR